MAWKWTRAKLTLASSLPLLVIAVLLSIYLPRTASPSGSQSAQSIASPADDPALIYSHDANDPWNKIFRALFTRTITTRLSNEFSEGAPFVQVRDTVTAMKVSTRTFERFEIGDRAIDPLYPSFFNSTGVRSVLTDPRYSELKAALNAALTDKTNRSLTSRALMQSDAWAAHDIIAAVKGFSGSDNVLLVERRNELLGLLSRLIRKVALTLNEIQLLPDTYRDSASRLKLPALFTPNGEWIEVQLSPHRMHDFSGDYRRAARVFFKPIDAARDKKSILEELRNGNTYSLIDSVALVVQDMLVDATGTVTPSHLAIDVQVRRFTRDGTGKVIGTELEQFELSRRALLTKPSDGGLIKIDKNHDLYLPAAGNDYQFASPFFTRQGNDYPVLVSLQQRCEGCHGKNSLGLFTLSTHEQYPLPPISLLSPTENVHGWYVAGRKQEREDFKSLMKIWRSQPID
jgi:hypothetical protein